ncbi:carboxymuconolactone decarboxylase family protein [Streptomyces sp. NBC_01381]|uniref:carboxymuconolactone decarboxylase family protein n=1 Tax=Streptomyces sp. NBC_01381 TaxID=2903845 RepID=UPI00225655FC|nr:carboxymuconolactone decarboxylase family protein [Streptomyces sp. NBC_01381]MCX4666252.1 carboxymuconolactone decarboxylase family protein [Streptomyces sp. NBC_01381]
MFAEHTVETAPAESRAAMERTAAAFGKTPSAVARLAESPELLNGFLELSASFERSTLEPVAREVVIMTIAVRNDCHICVTMHTGKLRKLGAGTGLITALREGRALEDERLEAVRQFTLEVLATAGGVDDEQLKAFLSHGYTERNALEVVLGIGTYTMSTLANRLTRAT